MRNETKRAIALCSLGILAVLLSGILYRTVFASQPQSSINTSDGSGGPGYIMLHPATFHSTAVDDYMISRTNLFFDSVHTEGYLYAPIQLPNGARVTRLTYYCKNPGGINEARLVRSDTSSFGEADIILSAVSEEKGFTDQRVVDDTPLPGADVIDNSRYAYVVELNFFDMGHGQQAFGVRIDYEYGSFLPLATNE